MQKLFLYCVLLILFFIADKWYSKEVNVFPVSVHLSLNKKIVNQERIVPPPSLF